MNNFTGNSIIDELIGKPVKVGDVTVGKIIEAMSSPGGEGGSILLRMEIEHRGFPLYFNIPTSIEAIRHPIVDMPLEEAVATVRGVALHG